MKIAKSFHSRFKDRVIYQVDLLQMAVYVITIIRQIPNLFLYVPYSAITFPTLLDTLLSLVCQRIKVSEVIEPVT